MHVPTSTIIQIFYSYFTFWDFKFDISIFLHLKIFYKNMVVYCCMLYGCTLDKISYESLYNGDKGTPYEKCAFQSHCVWLQEKKKCLLNNDGATDFV